MTEEEITRFLFVRENPVPADLVMVFACIDEEPMLRRVVRGVELYREGYAPRLLLTGGGSTKESGILEAEAMAQIASRLGVPYQDILIESTSTNTFENAGFSQILLQKHRLMSGISGIILVSSWWHLKRVRLIMKKTFPNEISLICCPCEEECTETAWARSERCRKTVLNELRILQAFLQVGILSEDL